MIITEDMVRQISIGGIILGAGGGGSFQRGLEQAEIAMKYGKVNMISVDDCDPDDVILTVAGVGSPAATEAYITEEDYKKVVEMVQKRTGKTIKALLPCEMGGSSSFGPFVPAVLNQIPILDAACNGRAHPLGTMGSMGLTERKMDTVQAASGGNPEKHRHVELILQGTVFVTASLVRSAAVQAGGCVAVARNPVSVQYIKENAAIGCYTQSMKVGQAYLDGKTPEDKVKQVAKVLNSRLMGKGVIEHYKLETKNGLDVGQFDIAMEDKSRVHMSFWNEYMAADCISDGKAERYSTFPDFMMTFDGETGEPFTSAEVYNGRSCYFVAGGHENLLLGAGMYEKSGYEMVEQALEISIINNRTPIRDLDS